MIPPVHEVREVLENPTSLTAPSHAHLIVYDFKDFKDRGLWRKMGDQGLQGSQGPGCSVERVGRGVPRPHTRASKRTPAGAPSRTILGLPFGPARRRRNGTVAAQFPRQPLRHNGYRGPTGYTIPCVR